MINEEDLIELLKDNLRIEIYRSINWDSEEYEPVMMIEIKFGDSQCVASDYIPLYELKENL